MFAKFIFGISVISLNALPFQSVMAQDISYKIVEPPKCMNDKNETVEFRTRNNDRLPVAAGMANRDGEGKPFVMRFNYSKSPPAFQAFIDRHECAHHQVGDVDRPHPPRNSQAHLLNESISDCIAILRLRDENEYGLADLKKVAQAMRHDMAEIGFPEISISSRISNLENCHARDGSAQGYIEEIKERKAS